MGATFERGVDGLDSDHRAARHGGPDRHEWEKVE